ncbi:phosphatidylglycerophosphatase A family protein [Acidisarcina polymorpha]|uniref:phosphatidylglycerophosphatase A family protein n=1 Tax=Acidisarcina polymorpha TaxID=2211140 RepID=UPI001F1A3F58|nr:phosphatidylglycerophosphatase A [Acidisarcina polymorpha]
MASGRVELTRSRRQFSTLMFSRISNLNDARPPMRTEPREKDKKVHAVEATGKRTLWAWMIATFFGAGFWKPGPGTAGSIVAAAVWWIFGQFAIHFHGSTAALATYQGWVTAVAALLLLMIAIPAATIVAKQSGRKDPQIVVADEVVGQWITLIAAPVNWQFALVGLLLFRLFDITKPPPIRRIEFLPGGWGIMLDDVGAGIYALICVQILHHLLK